MAITFDTLKSVKRLKESGFPEAQAEAIIEALVEAKAEHDLATKQDLNGSGKRLVLAQDLKEFENRMALKFFIMWIIAIGVVTIIVIK